MADTEAQTSQGERTPRPPVIGAWWDIAARPDHHVMEDWARMADGGWLLASLLLASLLVSGGVLLQDLPQHPSWLPASLVGPLYFAIYILGRSLIYLCATMGVAGVFAAFAPRSAARFRDKFRRALAAWALAQPSFGVLVVVLSIAAALLSALSGTPQIGSLHGLVTGAMVRGAVAFLELTLAGVLFARLHLLIVQAGWAATGKRNRTIMIVAAWAAYLGIAVLTARLVQAIAGAVATMSTSGAFDARMRAVAAPRKPKRSPKS